jgi:hypothetical protein
MGCAGLGVTLQYTGCDLTSSVGVPANMSVAQVRAFMCWLAKGHWRCLTRKSCVERLQSTLKSLKSTLHSNTTAGVKQHVAQQRAE